MTSTGLAALPSVATRETDRTAPAHHRVDTAVVVLAGLALFAAEADFVMRGDAAAYADIVVRAGFDELTLHLGYYVALFAAHRTVGAALGLPIHELMVWANVVLGALALGIAHRLARHFLQSRRLALLAVGLMAVSGRVLDNATTSEVYMMQTCLVLGSFLLFVRERVAAAGVAAALALLVTPLSVFGFLFFPVLDHQRAGRVRWRVLLRLAAAAAVVYVPFLLVHGQELLWGRRGLLGIDASTPFDPASLLVRLPLYQFKHYTVLLLLLVPALAALRSHRRLLALTLAVGLPHLYVVANLTSEDHVFLLPTDLFFACWLALGWRRLAALPRLAPLAPVPLAGHLALLAASGALFHGPARREYAAEMARVADVYLAGRDAALVSDWDATMALTFFGRDSVAGRVDHDPLFRQMVDVAALPAQRPPALRAAELYVLDPWEPGPLKRLLAPAALVEAHRDRSGVAARTRRLLGVECTLVERVPHPLYRCARPAPARNDG